MEHSRSTCHHCHHPLTLRAPRFCPVCFYDPDREARVVHVTHDFLTALQPQVKAARLVHVLQVWLGFQREIGQIAVNHAPPTAALAQRVQPEADSWAQWRRAVRWYVDALPVERAPAAEFCFVFPLAADRLLYHLRRLRTPQTRLARACDTYAFEWYSHVFDAGLCFTDPPALQVDPLAAVKAMRKELFDGLAWQAGALQEHPREDVRDWGSILFSGVMRSMIRRDVGRLWNALGREGEPHHVVLERLPPHVYAAWHTGPWSSLKALRNHLVKLMIDDGASASLRSHLSPHSLRQAQQELAQWDHIASPLEEWSATQAVSQALDALAAQAGFSPREAEVFALLRQGLTQEQIGARLTPPQSRDTVKTLAERAMKKVRKRAGN